MIEIPRRIAEHYRFIKIAAREKSPFEKAWQKENNYSSDDPRLIKHLAADNNYGVLCGINGLVVCDFDDNAFFDEVKANLPETFTVISGTGKPHLYYSVDKPASFKISAADGRTLCDIQGPGKQVVGPGSVHPNGNRYHVEKDIDIAKVTIAELRAAFGIWLLDETKHKAKYNSSDDIENEIRRRVLISTVLRQNGINATPTSEGKRNCECPFHASKNGKCFAFDDYEKGGVWYCHHCNRGGSVIKLRMLLDKKSYSEIRKEYVELFKLNDMKPPELIYEFLDLNDLAKQLWDIRPYYYDEAKIFWYWDHKDYCWKKTDEIGLLCNLTSVISKNVQVNVGNPYIMSELVNHFKIIGRDRKPKDIEWYWVQIGDTIYDVRNNKSFKSTPQYFVCNPIPHKLGDSDQTPIIDKLVADWVSEENRQTLIEWTAYCLLPGYPIHVIGCFIGSGRNGKSSYMRLIRNLVGEHNCCSSSLDLLVESKFECAKLYKKLVCQMGETDWATLKKTEKLKSLVGQDFIGMEFKYKSAFNAHNYAKLMISTNSLPSSNDTSEGFYRRWMIIDFPNNFPEGRDIMVDIPEAEYERLLRKCLRVLPGLLNRGMFTNMGSVDERQKRYIEASNPLSMFISENYYITGNHENYVRYSYVYQQYMQYLLKRKMRRVGHSEFRKMLSDEDLFVDRCNKKNHEGVYEVNRWIFGLVPKDHSHYINTINENRESMDGEKTVTPERQEELPKQGMAMVTTERVIDGLDYNRASIGHNLTCSIVKRYIDTILEYTDAIDIELILSQLPIIFGVERSVIEQHIMNLISNGDFFERLPGRLSKL